MKMADLKAFVETKILSKSERTLERIGQDGQALGGKISVTNALAFPNYA